MSLRRGVGAESVGGFGSSRGGAVTGAALKIRGARDAAGSDAGDGVAAGNVGASTAATCDLGLNSASAACRAVWACGRS